MNIVSGIGIHEALERAGSGAGKVITNQTPRGPPNEDTVEISPVGIALSDLTLNRARGLSGLWEIRAEVKAGVFETPERQEKTIARLLEIFGRASSIGPQAIARWR